MNRVFNNALWIIVCKVLQMIIGLVVSMLVARYLGPAKFGLISYASALVTFCIPAMQLGLRSTLVQELISEPEQEGKVLGTAVLLNLIGAIACMVGILSAVLFLHAEDTETILVCALYNISLLFMATEIIQYWFQSKLLSKYPSLAMLFSSIAVSGYKIYLLVSGMSVYWFAVSQAIDAALISIVLFYFYKRYGTQKLSISLKLGKAMFSRSKYYIVSGLMVNVFQLSDRVMLMLMVGDEVTGFYSAAATCAGITTFVFLAIIDSMRPSILQKKKDGDQAGFEDEMSDLFCIITYLSLAQSVLITLLADILIYILYGSEFMDAAPVLRLVVWYISFACLGTVRNVWILGEEKQKYLWRLNTFAAGANIALNLVLIPVWGALGAAAASVVTQFLANVALNQAIPAIRPCNVLMLRGLNPKRLARLGHMIRRG